MRLKLTVAYDGAPFRGFAINEGIESVGGRLTDALETALQHKVSVTCAGRTDAGVHAWGQVVSVEAHHETLDLRKLHRSLNKMCGPEVVVREVEIADPDFDARYHASWRSYRYTILNRLVPDPFLRFQAWHVTKPLDVAAMNEAARVILGSHDFSSFCRRQQVLTAEGEEVEAPRVRRVLRAEWVQEQEDLVRFDVKAGSFCYRMVRALVGTMVEIGLGDEPVSHLAETLKARHRDLVGPLAPPHGLTFWTVGY